jgi:carbon-monoxide dehydrogenase medium subunit
MYPAAFEYVAVGSFDEASEQLRRAGGDAKVLAGGCSLIPLMKLRLAEPRLIIDLNRVPDAAYVKSGEGVLQIGALTREADVESSPLVAGLWPILVDTSSVIADPLVRNMGTLGGNVAHADPANDHPATMLALDAAFVVTGGRGPRVIPAADFFQDLFVTALAEDEVVTEIRIPFPEEGTGSAYVKYEHQVGDFAVAAIAVVLQVREGRVTVARIGLTNVGPTPLRASAAEAVLVGAEPDDATVDAAAARAADGLEPWSDLRGSADYKRHLVRGLTGRAIRRALERAGVREPNPNGKGAGSGAGATGAPRTAHHR